jgi:hypothetical protein
VAHLIGAALAAREKERMAEQERQHLAEEERRHDAQQQRETEKQRLAQEELQRIAEIQREAQERRQAEAELGLLGEPVPWGPGEPSQAAAMPAEPAALQRVRIRELEEEAARLMAARRYRDVLPLLEPAAVEFPEAPAFPRLLGQAREALAAEQKALRLDAAERKAQDLLAGQRYQDALAEADATLAEYPGEQAVVELRARIVAAIEEQAAVARVIELVERLAGAAEGTQAHRALEEGLRRYPGRAELANLRAAVDAARQAERERKSREAGLKRAATAIDKLLAQGKLAEAGVALGALEKKFGAGAAPEVAHRIVSAVEERERETERQREAAERQRLADEEEQREVELQRLAAEEQQREAERERLAAEERQREVELQRLAAEEQQREAERQRLAAAEQQREAERQRLADEEEQRAAELQRLAAEEQQRAAERERLAAEERQREAELQRLAAEEQQREAERERLADEEEQRETERQRLAAAERQREVELQRLAAEEQQREAERERLAAEERQRRTQREREAQEAGLKRAVAVIDKLLAKGQLAEAGAGLEALEREYGVGSAPGVAQRIAAAVAEQEREAERQRLAAVAEQERAAQALDAAFRQVVDKVGRLAQQQQWQQARQLAAPFLENPRTQAQAEILLNGLIRQEQYCARIRELEEQARARLAAKQYQEAIALLERAVREFPEVAILAQLLSEAREGFTPELKAQRLSAAERSIKSRIAGQRFEEAVAEADAALSEHPGDKTLRALRTMAAAGIHEKAAIAGVAGEVQRLIALGEGIQSDRVLVEGLRRYPGRAELTDLRPAVDAARKSEANRLSREARLKRAVEGIGRLLGKGKQP